MSKIPFRLSLLLALLLIVANGGGLTMSWQLYTKETPDWFAQSIGQDMADIFIVLPFLLVSSLLAYRGSKKAFLIWAGVMAYIVYTFTIYCFAIHFNQLFIVYCLALGLAVYLLAWFILSQYARPVKEWFNNKAPVKLAGIYMITIAIIFYVLWLMQIVPANINNTVPKEISDTGLFTNPVHVLDLSVCLPTIFITGILLLRRHWFAFLLAPAVLTFFILMDGTIGGLMIIMKWRGLEANNAVVVVMLILALFSTYLLIALLRNRKDPA